MRATRASGGAVDRVRKLLRLAHSPNPHEAASARQSAREIMSQHGLGEDDVAEDVSEVVEDCADPYRAELARAVALALDCSAEASRRGALAFRGRPEVVRRAGATYRALARAAEAGSEMSPVGDPPLVAREAWRICWWMGFAAAVVERLRLGELRAPACSRSPRGGAPATSPPASVAALEALECLAEQLSLQVSDAAGVAERLRQRAYVAGCMAGQGVPLAEAQHRGLLRRG